MVFVHPIYLVIMVSKHSSEYDIYVLFEWSVVFVVSVFFEYL